MPISFISRILNVLEGLFGHDANIVSLEIGERFVSVVESRSSKKGRFIRNIGRMAIKPGPDSQSSETVKELLSSLSIKTRRVHLLIGRHLVAVRFLRLPSIDSEEIVKMAKSEALKYIPSQTEEEPIVGCRIVERCEDGYSQVLVAMLQAETASRLLGILRASGLEAASICLGSEALFIWSSMAGITPVEKPTMIVNAGAEYVDTVVIEGEKPVFTRGIAVGPDEALYGVKVAKEISASAAAYKRESTKDIGSLVLTGEESASGKIGAAVGGELSIEVAVVGQKTGVQIDESAGDVDPDASFAELLGISMGHEKAAVNLLPERVIEYTSRAYFKKQFLLTLALVACVCLMVFGLCLKKIHDKTVHLSYISTQRAHLASEAKVARGAMKDMAAIEDLFGSQPPAIEVLSEVVKATTSGISINTLDVEGGKTLVVRGNASALGDVFRYVKQLEGSPFFSNARVKYATRRSGAGSTVDFEIGCSLPGNNKKGRDNAAK